jgi:hypothetical protein
MVAPGPAQAGGHDGDLLGRRVGLSSGPAAATAADTNIRELVLEPGQEPPVRHPDRLGDVAVPGPGGEHPPGGLLLLRGQELFFGATVGGLHR